MIDSKTNLKVNVFIHEKYGPYIKVLSHIDAAELEDLLDDEYYVLYWKKALPEGVGEGGSEYYFGGGGDPEKIQKILDLIGSKSE